MKNTSILLLAALLFLTSCSGLRDQQFTVNGKVNRMSPSMVYLEEIPMATMQPVTVDSVRPNKDGSFVLRAKVTEETVFNVRIDKQEYPAASVINDGKKVDLQIFFDPVSKVMTDRYEVKGSVASSALQSYLLEFNSQLLKGKVDSLRVITERALGVSKSPALSMMIISYYQSLAGNPAFGLTGFTVEETKAQVKKLTEAFPKHKGLEAVSIMMATQPASSKGMVGQTAPEFSLPDPNGKMISLSSFRGKYVLVDFWASWCKPCRMENPNVVNAYAQFKNRNFTVLGVSLDQEGEKDEWMKAVMKDNLTWTQVSDLQFWNSPVVSLYNIQGIPFNVLVDPTGKIIAESLRGDALATTLDKVLPK